MTKTYMKHAHTCTHGTHGDTRTETQAQSHKCIGTHRYSHTQAHAQLYKATDTKTHICMHPTSPKTMLPSGVPFN